MKVEIENITTDTSILACLTGLVIMYYKTFKTNVIG